jgi:hypothetical protein
LICSFDEEDETSFFVKGVTAPLAIFFSIFSSFLIDWRIGRQVGEHPAQPAFANVEFSASYRQSSRIDGFSLFLCADKQDGACDWRWCL